MFVCVFVFCVFVRVFACLLLWLVFLTSLLFVFWYLLIGCVDGVGVVVIGCCLIFRCCLFNLFCFLRVVVVGGVRVVVVVDAIVVFTFFDVGVAVVV